MEGRNKVPTLDSSTTVHDGTLCTSGDMKVRLRASRLRGRELQAY
jgi:hypothetical protein